MTKAATPRLGGRSNSCYASQSARIDTGRAKHASYKKRRTSATLWVASESIGRRHSPHTQEKILSKVVRSRTSGGPKESLEEELGFSDSCGRKISARRITESTPRG